MDTPDTLAVDLLKAAAGAVVGASTVVGRSANSIKKQARENVLRSAPVHNAGAHKAINYDTPSISGARIETEVGYDKSKPGGSLGNLLEYGGGGDHSPPHRDIGRAADAEEAALQDALQTMALRLL